MSGVNFTLNGQPCEAREGETILKAAERAGVSVPRLCYTDGLRPDGNCRACVVEVKGERTLAPSCCRLPTPGMTVDSASPRAVAAQTMVLELLVSDAGAASAHEFRANARDFALFGPPAEVATIQWRPR